MKVLRDFGLKTDDKTYVIAEVGINHNGQMDTALQLIDAVARTGANAVKFQTYITEKRTPKGSPIFDILKKCELPFESFKTLRDYAKNKGLDFFSTPFDTESVQFLNGMGVDLFKVASFDVTNMSLLKTIAATKKPVILSVGLSNMAEIKNAYGLLSEYTKNIVLLHCISAYPTNEEDANLSAIETLKATFPCLIGHSDHTPEIFVPSLAVAAGARVIEKHFKLDDNCVDAPVSINELQLKELVKNIRRIERIQGSGTVELTEAQKPCAQYRRHSAL